MNTLQPVLLLATLAVALLKAPDCHAQPEVDTDGTLERMRASGLFFVHSVDDTAWAILARASTDMVAPPLRSRPRSAESDVILRSAPLAETHRGAFGHVSGGAARLAADGSTCDVRLGEPVVINLIYLDNLQNHIDESSIANIPRAPAAVDRLLTRLSRDPDENRLDPSLWVAAPIQGACIGAVVGAVLPTRPPGVFVGEWLEGQELANATAAYQQTAVYRDSEGERSARREAEELVQFTATRFTPQGAPGDMSYVFVATEYEIGCGDDGSDHHAAFTYRASTFTVLPMRASRPYFLGDVNGDGLLEVLFRDAAGVLSLHQLDLGTNTLTPLGTFHTQHAFLGC
ncbi:MAG: hypothetical protein IPL19_14755 [Sandaracinaceae bacterium]|nr:hypothetical protein [Sandaracinaceae bacterium]